MLKITNMTVGNLGSYSIVFFAQVLFGPIIFERYVLKST